MLLHSSSGCYQTPSNIEDLSFQTAVGRWRRSVPVGILVAALDRPLLYMFKKNPRSGVSLSDYRVYLIMYVFMFSLCFVYIPHHTRTVPFFFIVRAIFESSIQIPRVPWTLFNFGVVRRECRRKDSVKSPPTPRDVSKAQELKQTQRAESIWILSSSIYYDLWQG